jgi:hypothetical protein
MHLALDRTGTVEICFLVHVNSRHCTAFNDPVFSTHILMGPMNNELNFINYQIFIVCFKSRSNHGNKRDHLKGSYGRISLAWVGWLHKGKLNVTTSFKSTFSILSFINLKNQKKKREGKWQHKYKANSVEQS